MNTTINWFIGLPIYQELLVYVGCCLAAYLLFVLIVFAHRYVKHTTILMKLHVRLTGVRSFSDAYSSYIIANYHLREFMLLKKHKFLGFLSDKPLSIELKYLQLVDEMYANTIDTLLLIDWFDSPGDKQSTFINEWRIFMKKEKFGDAIYRNFFEKNFRYKVCDDYLSKEIARRALAMYSKYTNYAIKNCKLDDLINHFSKNSVPELTNDGCDVVSIEIQKAQEMHLFDKLPLVYDRMKYLTKNEENNQDLEYTHHLYSRVLSSRIKEVCEENIPDSKGWFKKIVVKHDESCIAIATKAAPDLQIATKYIEKIINPQTKKEILKDINVLFGTHSKKVS